MTLGSQQKKILRWMYEHPNWIFSGRIIDELMPESYSHPPRFWLSRRMTSLKKKGLVKDRYVGVKNMKVWKITDLGRQEVEKLNGNKKS